MPSVTSCPGKIGFSSSYPQAGQTNPSQQKYGTVNPHAGHDAVAMSPPPSPRIASTSSRFSRLYPFAAPMVRLDDHVSSGLFIPPSDDILVSSGSILAYQKAS